jgi:hypothetical protein
MQCNQKAEKAGEKAETVESWDISFHTRSYHAIRQADNAIKEG